ncbi:MAG: hypothetical protein ACPGVC_11035 [Salibacteraceae bacterium]
MKNTFTILLFLSGLVTHAQPNCQAFLYYGDTLKYEACVQASQAAGHYQFSREYQESLDKAIAIDSTFYYPYWAKSIAYLKSGDFITWQKLIDKAVELKPTENLGYRGWCRYQFFRDYQGAITDIETLEDMVDHDIGYSQNGTYHLKVALALCYKAIGEPQKAVQLMKDQIQKNEEENFVGTYDYLHLGVLYLELEEYDLAAEAFKNQTNRYELAENQYYLALLYKTLNEPEKAKVSLRLAKDLYVDRIRLFDPYSNPMDRIYLENIESQMMALGM